MSQSHRETFENIHMDFSTSGGRCRFAESGLGWKPSGDKDSKENSVPFTLGNDQMQHAYWNRSARGYELKIYRKDRNAPPVVQFDGFTEEDYDRIGKIIRNWYGLPFDKEEHSLRGWNWGKAEFGKAELSFNVQSRSAFAIPYTEVSNTNLAGKGEVAVEFSLPGDGEQTGTNGHLGGARAGGNKAGAARDQLVEMRFYIPGMTSVKGKDEDGEDGEVNEDAEEQQAADVFYQTLSEKAEIGEVAGDTIATFQDVLHLTPRQVIQQLMHLLHTNICTQRPKHRRNNSAISISISEELEQDSRDMADAGDPTKGRAADNNHLHPTTSGGDSIRSGSLDDDASSNYGTTAATTPSGLSRTNSFSGSGDEFDESIPPLDRLTIFDLIENLALPQKLERLQSQISLQTNKVRRQQERIKSTTNLARDKVVEEWRRRVPTADEQLEKYKKRMRQSVDRLNTKWSDSRSVTLREKISFIAGVMNVFVSGYLVGGWPHLYPYWYSVQLCYFMPIRWYTYHKKGYHYFLADLCYFVNLLVMLSIWCFPNSKRLFISAFCLAFGNNAIAIAMWRNSLVFHSMDKVVSYVHASPLQTFQLLTKT